MSDITKTPPTLSNPVALVTGAARGIGRAIALRLAAAGFDIAVHYGNSHGEAQHTVKAIEKLGARGFAIGADMRRVSDIQRLFGSFDQYFDRLDILVNNAGAIAPSPLETLCEEQLIETFAVNVKGPAIAAREASRRLGDGGRIVNISSSRAHFPAAGTTCYAGSKAALEWMTRVWAAELGHRGITVNAVAPGPTVPGMFERAPEALRATARETTPFGRLGDADEVADVVEFLCSEKARWITGQVILVNGGGRL